MKLNGYRLRSIVIPNIVRDLVGHTEMYDHDYFLTGKGDIMYRFLTSLRFVRNDNCVLQTQVGGQLVFANLSIIE